MNRNERRMILEMTGIIFFYTVIVAVFEMIWSHHRFYAFAGLMVGMFLAIYMLVYMQYILSVSFALGENGAQKNMVKHAVIRYMSVALVFGVVCVTNLADPIACFLGLMGLKVAAYLQPPLDRFFHRKGAENEAEK